MVRTITWLHLALPLLLEHVVGAWAVPSLSSRDPTEAHDNEVGDLQRRNTILVVHAVCGFLALQVAAPIGVVIASVGRSWGPLWFKLHYRMQLFLAVPLTYFAVGLAAVLPVLTYDKDRSMHKHKFLGFVLVGLLLFQVIIGAWAHIVQTKKRQNAREDEVLPDKRRIANWSHIALGIAILTLGGLQVTWGFEEWKRLGNTVPLWISLVHWIIAGVPVAVVTPFVVIGGLLRMRRGQSLAQAFFDRPATSRQYVPPRELFLGTSEYRATGLSGDRDEEHEGLIGHAYSKGDGVGGRQLIQGDTEWIGATTREEYEASLTKGSSRGSTSSNNTSRMPHESILFDAELEANHVLLPLPGTRSPAPSIWPGSSEAVASSPPPVYPPTPSAGTPYIAANAPTIPTSKMTPLSLPALSPPPAPAPAISPRLAFMPFSGTAVVNHRASTSAASRTVATPVSTSTLPSIRSHLSGDHARQVVLVPETSTPSPRPASVTTSAAATCAGGAQDDPQDKAPVPLQISRHASLSAEIVGGPNDRLEQQGGVLEPASEEPKDNEGDSRDDADSVVLDDAESTRLMDELERELSVSDNRDDLDTVQLVAVNGGVNVEREPSGKWFSGSS
ncbi:cytochrome b561 domain-containing protein [Sporobolomyces koalae]|uniref:cytochrome b561 domain-containing protein n=1 Tax=Sporobolomyces koalae TaxID=500713 RepID=UPI00317484BB